MSLIRTSLIPVLIASLTPKALVTAFPSYAFGGESLTPIKSELPSELTWLLDDDLKIQLAYFPNGSSTNGQARGLTPIFQHIAPTVPDIANIKYSAISGLGFPLPPRKDSESQTLFLKLYNYPEGLDASVSIHRIFDSFHLWSLPKSTELYQYAVKPENVRTKYAFAAPSQSRFGPHHPLPGPWVVSQDQFDRSIPFSSIYVRPTGKLQEKLEMKPATNDLKAERSAQGVVAFHRELVGSYRETFELVEDDENRTVFASRTRCASNTRRLCSVRILEVPKKPLVFSNYRELPMPQDPAKVFLSGLLLVRLADCTPKRSMDLDVNLKPLSSKFKNLFNETYAHMLEVGSVVDFRE